MPRHCVQGHSSPQDGCRENRPRDAAAPRLLCGCTFIYIYDLTKLGLLKPNLSFQSLEQNTGTCTEYDNDKHTAKYHCAPRHSFASPSGRSCSHRIAMDHPGSYLHTIPLFKSRMGAPKRCLGKPPPESILLTWRNATDGNRRCCHSLH